MYFIVYLDPYRVPLFNKCLDTSSSSFGMRYELSVTVFRRKMQISLVLQLHLPEAGGSHKFEQEFRDLSSSSLFFSIPFHGSFLVACTSVFQLP